MKTPVRSIHALPALLGLALAAAGAPVHAADVYTLTPEQKAAALQSGGVLREDAPTVSGRGSLPVHGEVGALIGTGGMRSVFGTAAIPLGENGGAIVSFENSRFGQTRRR